MKRDYGRALIAYNAYTANRSRPDGSAYPRFSQLSKALQDHWLSVATASDTWAEPIQYDVG